MDYNELSGTVAPNSGDVYVWTFEGRVILVGAVGSFPLANGRRLSPYILLMAAILNLLTYRHLFPSIFAPWHGIYALCLAGAAAANWLRDKRFLNLIATVACLAISAAHIAEHYVGTSLNLVFFSKERNGSSGAQPSSSPG